MRGGSPVKKKNAVKLSAAAAVLLLLSGCAAQSRVGDELRSGLLLTLERQQLAAVHAGLERLDALSAARERRRGSVGREDLFANHEKEKGQRRYKYVFLGPEGTAGRLVIPSVGISVAVNLPGEDAQLTADEPDSACWMEYGYGQNPVIGDHVNQEFSALSLVKPGDTCTLVKGGRPYEYRCLSVGYGSNIETDVLDSSGVSIFQREEDKLFLYTCANGWRYVFISEWLCEDDEPLHQVTSPGSVAQIVFQDDEPG